MSNFMKAASIAWLKEFWKLGTGTRSELSLSPSLSTGAGGTKLLSSEKGSVKIVTLVLRGVVQICPCRLPLPSARSHLSLEQFWATRLLLLCQPSASAKWDRRKNVKCHHSASQDCLQSVVDMTEGCGRAFLSHESGTPALMVGLPCPSWGT